MKYKTTIAVCAFVLATFASSGSIAKPTIYVDALDLAAHSIKQNKLSLKGAVEIPINKTFNFGIQGGHTQASDIAKRSLSSVGVYLDYKFLESERPGKQKDSWFIRSYVGLSKVDAQMVSVSNNTPIAATANQDGFGSGNSANGGGAGGSFGESASNSYGYGGTTRRPFVEQPCTPQPCTAQPCYPTVIEHHNTNTINNNVERLSTISILGSQYHPEYGVYIGKKYVFDNSLTMQFGAGISTAIKHTEGTHYRIKASDFIVDTFLRVGYRF